MLIKNYIKGVTLAYTMVSEVRRKRRERQEEHIPIDDEHIPVEPEGENGE